MIASEPGDDGESSSARAAKKWSPELPPASFTAVANDGGLRDRATDHYWMQLRFPEVRMLTAELVGGWKSMMMTGDELTATNSGKLR
jgi:hypothetical protein